MRTVFKSVIIGRGDDSALQGIEYPSLLALMDGEDKVTNDYKLTQIRISSKDDIAKMTIANFAGHQAAVHLATCDFRYSHPVRDVVKRDELLQEMWRIVRYLPGCWGTSIIDCSQGVINILKNARLLLGCPTLNQIKRLNVPAIAIGAGPSLKAALPALRSLRGRALMVACDTAMSLLDREGIHPEICTPLERLPATAEKLKGVYSHTLYAGTPVVPPAALCGFSRHILVAPFDVLYEWMCPTVGMMNPGSSSGSMAVQIAGMLTKSDVFLIGHDLCRTGDASHADSESISAKVQTHDQHTALGYDGAMHPSTLAWERTRIDIQEMNYHRKLFNASGSEGLGSVIQGVDCKGLPDPSMLSDLPEMEIGNGDERRYHDFLAYGRNLSSDFDAYVMDALEAKSVDDVGSKKYIHNRNHFAIDYIIRSIYAQMSIEKRLGHSEESLLLAFKNALSNVHKELGDALRRACESLVD